MTRSNLVCSAAVAAISSAAGLVIGADVHWALPTSGLWNDPLNWVQMRVPTPSDSVFIEQVGEYTVHLDQDAIIQRLSIGHGPTMELAAGRSLIFLEGLHNDGQILINPTSSDADTTLSFFYDDLGITGSGTLRLNGQGRDAQIVIPDLASFTNGPDHTIAGHGLIEANMTNLGTIRADTGTLSMFYIDLITNTGTMEARDGALLSCTISEIDQSGGGSIIANGSGSRVAIGNPTSSGSVVTAGAIHAEDGGSITKARGRLSHVNVSATGVESSVVIRDASMIAGVLRADPGSVIRVENSTLQSVDIQSPIRISDTVTITGEIRSDLVFYGFGFDEILLDHEVSVPYPASITLSGGMVRIEELGNPTIVPSNLTIRAGVDFYFGGINYATIIMGPGQSSGMNFGELYNYGEILATEDAGVLFSDCLVTNGDFIHIDKGSTLTIDDATVIRSGNGKILAERNSVVEIQNSQILSGFLLDHGTDATVTDSSVQLDPDDVIFADRYGTSLILNNSTVTGGLVHMFAGALLEPTRSSIDHLVLDSGQLEAGPLFEITGSLTNNGEIRLSHRDKDAMVLPDDLSILGDGEIIFEDAAQLVTKTGAQLTIGARQTLSGNGNIPVPLINHGLIASRLSITGSSFMNFGTVQATEPQPLAIVSPLVTQAYEGRIEAVSPGAIVRIVDANITGGSIGSINDGVVRIEGSTNLDDVAVDGRIDVFRGAQVALGPGVTFNGTLRINPGSGSGNTWIAWDPSQPPALVGALSLEGEQDRAVLLSQSADSTPIIIPEQLRLEGIGRIDVPTSISGTIAPGLATELGTLHANATMSFAPNAVLEISVGQSGADQLVNASRIELDGTLVIEPLGSSQLPDGYWTLQIAQAPEIVGGFSAIEAVGLSEGRVIRVSQAASSVSIVQTCITDFDLDGDQDFLDVSAFISAYTVGHPSADLQGDGDLNFFDISVFLAAYDHGCDL